MQKTIESLELLSAPIPENQILWKVGKKTADGAHGQALPYIDNRHVQSRLDELFGKVGWKNEYAEVTANAKLVAVRCTIFIKVGDEWIGKQDAAPVDAEKSVEFSVKGAYSDAMKRAAVQWGFGRYLYDFRAPLVELDSRGRLTRIPLLSEGVPKQDEAAGKAVDAEDEAVSGEASATTAAVTEKSGNEVKAEVSAKPVIKDIAPVDTKVTVVSKPAEVVKAAAETVKKDPVVSAEVAPEAPVVTPVVKSQTAAELVPPTEHAAGASDRAEAQADAAAGKQAPPAKVEAPVESVAATAPSLNAAKDDAPPSDLFIELVEKIKKLPTAMIRRYIEGPKGQEKLTPSEREALLSKIVAREVELAAA